MSDLPDAPAGFIDPSEPVPKPSETVDVDKDHRYVVPAYSVPVDDVSEAADDVAAGDEGEVTVAVIPLKPNPNISVRHPLASPYAFKETDNRISLLNMSFKELNERAESFDDTAANSSSKTEWLRAIDSAIGHLYADNAFDRSLTRNSSDWRQGVEVEGAYVGARKPKIKANPGALLTGEAALLRVRALSGLGAIVEIPLWHSGIWIKLKAPSDTELMEFNRSLSAAKTNYGRSTIGSIFSNESVFINTMTAEFALRQVYSASITDYSVDNLMKVIRATDIPTLVWGLACVVFANGYPMSRPCINNPRTCQHVEHELLNITKMLFTDNSALTPFQKNFMKEDKQRTPEEIIKYQEEFVSRHLGTVVPFNEHVTVKLGVPSIHEYKISGSNWIDGIVKMTEEAATLPLEGNVRETYINDQAKLTRLRLYVHWVKSLSLSSDERIEDRESIESILSSLSSNETWNEGEDEADLLLKKIAEFVDNVTISVVGIPRYECVGCGATQTDEYNKHPELIVVDVMKFFFTLVSQRLVSNLSRRR